MCDGPSTCLPIFLGRLFFCCFVIGHREVSTGFICKSDCVVKELHFWSEIMQQGEVHHSLKYSLIWYWFNRPLTRLMLCHWYSQFSCCMETSKIQLMISRMPSMFIISKTINFSMSFYLIQTIFSETSPNWAQNKNRLLTTSVLDLVLIWRPV